jgi:hypothetical protein
MSQPISSADSITTDLIMTFVNDLQQIADQMHTADLRSAAILDPAVEPKLHRLAQHIHDIATDLTRLHDHLATASQASKPVLLSPVG